MDVTTVDPLGEFRKRLQELVADFDRLTAGYPSGSRSLSFAIAAGLPLKSAYSVAETARYSGVSRSTLYAEHDAGRLKWVNADGANRGAVIDVEEMDRWMRENAR